jgi:outer membrane cobalamin receptor
MHTNTHDDSNVSFFGRMHGAIGLKGVLFSLFATSAVAQMDAPSSTVEEVIVVGSGIPKSVSEMTHSVTVVDELAIEEAAFTDFTEILRMQPGLEFKQAGGPGQFNYPKLRGLPAQNILVVIDGVKVNSGGSGNVGNLMGQLNPYSIERLEILRGPQATLYGANSTAGVIAITTKSGDRPDVGIRTEGGSLGWKNLFGSYRGSTRTDNGEFSYSMNAAATDSDGVHPEEFYEDATAQFKVSYATGAVTFGASGFHSDSTFQAAELDEAYCCQTRETHWAFQTPDPNNESVTEQLISGAFISHTISDSLSQTLRFGYTTKRYEILDADDGLLGLQSAPFDDFAFGGETYNAGDEVPILDDAGGVAAFYDDVNSQVSYEMLYAGDGFNVLGGTEYLQQEADQWGTYGTSGNEHSVTSLYLNGDVDLFDGVVVLALGARHDSFDSWGDKDTGNIGLAWQLAENTSLFANYGTSFAAPTMSQLFNPSYGNQNLHPESGDTVEVGIRQQFGDRVRVDLAYWDTQIDDVIFFDYTANNPNNVFGGQYNNGEEHRSEGIELSASFDLSDAVELYGNYTYTDSQALAVGGDWTPAVQIAQNKGNLGARYSSDRMSFSVNAYYAGPRFRWAGDIEMKSYVRVDVSGRYQITDQIDLHARIENLFDEYIEEGLGYEQPGVYGIIGIQARFL